MHMMKLYVKTYGCQMNAYDSSKMADVLMASHQVQLTEDPIEADIILLNTCSIREKAQEKVFSELGRFRKLNKNSKKLILGVGGCVASQEGSAICDRAPFVNMVFGPQTLHRLPQMLDEVLQGKKSVVDVSFPEIEKFDHLPKPRAEGPTAYVSIMEGCSKYCSFCVVPYTRGEEISRPFSDVIREVAALCAQGVREIYLLGQNVNDYQGVMHTGDIADLATLVHYVAAIDGVGRIRYTTSHPLAFSQNLIDAYAEVPMLANQLHLPVQSGSDRILAAMKRNYTAVEYKSKIRKLRKVRPDICISSDFIVGFPGETEEDFEKTLCLVRDVNFDHSFSFIYSPRPGTPAASLPDDTPMEVKKERLNRLQILLQTQAMAISDAMLGSVQTVLVYEPSKKYPPALSGRTENNRVVHFEGQEHLIGQFVDVCITDVSPYELRARLFRHSAPKYFLG